MSPAARAFGGVVDWPGRASSLSGRHFVEGAPKTLSEGPPTNRPDCLWPERKSRLRLAHCPKRLVQITSHADSVLVLAG